MKPEETRADGNDFASMFEKSLEGIATYRVGQAVETVVVSISGDAVFLQLGGKSEGVIDRDELVDKEGRLAVAPGDAVKAYFLGTRDGEMRFTTKIAGEKAGSEMIERAYRDGIPVEGLVVKEIKGGYEVKIGESKAFCPYSQMGARRTEDASEHVGRQLTFRIMEYKEGGRRLLVSNRAILEEARQNELEELRKTLVVGAVLKGTVVSIRDFGAFVDIGGIQALLPVSEISRARVEKAEEALSVGQEVEVAVLKLDWQNERFTVSMKSLLADPWDCAKERYPVDSRHVGTVARVADFGVFVALEPGIDGLVHVSELRAASRSPDGRSETPKVGQEMSVKVLGVDPSKRRISLKPALAPEEDAAARAYMDSTPDGETYNPFANLLGKKRG